MRAIVSINHIDLYDTSELDKEFNGNEEESIPEETSDLDDESNEDLGNQDSAVIGLIAGI